MYTLYLISNAEHLANSEFMLSKSPIELVLLEELLHEDELLAIQKSLPLDTWIRLPFETLNLLLACRGKRQLGSIHPSWKETSPLSPREIKDILEYQRAFTVPMALEHPRFEEGFCHAIVRTSVCHKKTSSKMCSAHESL
jgi:hypothetical protein